MRKLNTLPSANMRSLPNCTRLPRPLELQYKAPVEVLPELPQEPTIGEFYMYKSQKVLCIARTGCDVCARGDEPTCRGLVNCNTSARADEKSIQLLAVD